MIDSDYALESWARGPREPTLADTIRVQIEQHRDALRGWAEPHGHLVPSEPNPDERALIRIRLRASIIALQRALGVIDRPQEIRFEDDDLRDRLRIHDRAVAEVRETAPAEVALPFARFAARIRDSLVARYGYSIPADFFERVLLEDA